MIEKQCNCCKEVKQVDNFYKHKTTKDRLSTYCKVCILQQCRNAHYKKRYGITSKEADNLKKECELCGSTDNLHIDHNHETNEVRGVLCTNCNRGIGHLKDSPTLLLKAVKYLEKYGNYSTHD
jgi:hypothetical protein